MDAKMKNLDASFRKAGNELEKLNTQHDTHLKAIKGRFNLFTVLLGIGDETRLHSRWLAYLLNPKREHDCGSLFLDLFLNTLKQIPPLSHSGVLMDSSSLSACLCKDAKVSTEVRTEDGRMDIRIECPSWGVIVIENKIWAAEQPNQIGRYTRHLDDSGKRYLLLYLTLHGSQSQTADGSCLENYYRISYRDHILKWLEDCLRATYEHVNINQALQQYKGVVSHLIGNTLDAIYMEQIAELLKDHPAIVKHRDAINSGIEQLKQNYWMDFIGELRKQLMALGIEMESQEDSGKDKSWRGFWFAEKHDARLDNNHSLRFLIQWLTTENFLKFGALPQVKTGASVKENNDTVAELWKMKRSEFENIGQQLKNDFPTFITAAPSWWWPLGQYQLIPGFMSNTFLAEKACDDRPAVLHELVEPGVNMIRSFLALTTRYVEKQTTA